MHQSHPYSLCHNHDIASLPPLVHRSLERRDPGSIICPTAPPWFWQPCIQCFLNKCTNVGAAHTHDDTHTVAVLFIVPRAVTASLPQALITVGKESLTANHMPLTSHTYNQIPAFAPYTHLHIHQTTRGHTHADMPSHKLPHSRAHTHTEPHTRSSKHLEGTLHLQL